VALEVYEQELPRQRQIESNPFERDGCSISLWLDNNRKSARIGVLIDASQIMKKYNKNK
jgi:hypothetical protein